MTLRVNFAARLAAILLTPMAPAAAQPAGLEVEWRVVNRFRLFTDRADFERHEQAYEALTRELGRPPGVLDTERRLAAGNGRGWAESVIGRTCLDPLTGRLRDPCRRDGLDENPVNPRSHLVRLESRGAPPGATCRWIIAHEGRVEREDRACDAIFETRLRHRITTRVALEVVDAAPPARAETDIAVRDVLLVGLGDSIASGEGNPERPVALRNDGFCFRRLLDGDGSDEYFLPGRAGVTGVPRDCPSPGETPDFRREWERGRAGWSFAACHRSLYSHQTRTALMLAVQNPRLAVTYIPLACSGATIAKGMRGAIASRERLELPNGRLAPAIVEAQLTQLRNLVRPRGRPPVREIDVVLLTIGANDIGFSGLVADAMIAAPRERRILRSLVSSVAEARRQLSETLRPGFATLRAELAPFVQNDFSRVVFTTYGNPALGGPGTACPSGRRGFDGHPAFAVNGRTTADIVAFVEGEFFPTLAALATCGAGGGCRPSRPERMRFVNGHQADFAAHGFCAAAPTDPAFDRDCFTDGQSFRTGPDGLTDPLRCARPATSFAPYASRARWIRTPNDSYFTAMSYPDSLPWFLRPSDIHDALWGVASVVHGGAIHPTAEGHARMADATVEAARAGLGLPDPAAVDPVAAAGR